jgi:hypothetical protein
MLRLQNGRFDVPGRAFHSISETWTGVLNNPADVKELIPEFFYNGDNIGCFLVNGEKLNFGVRDNKEKVDHVLLPPWAVGRFNF